MGHGLNGLDLPTLFELRKAGGFTRITFLFGVFGYNAFRIMYGLFVK